MVAASLHAFAGRQLCAKRERSATESGDARAGAKRALSIRASVSANWIERREPDLLAAA